MDLVQDPPSRNVVGIGRLCTDTYFAVDHTGSRQDSKKWSGREFAQAYGGSVPRALAAASGFPGVTCSLVAALSTEDLAKGAISEELSSSGVRLIPIPSDRSAKSQVYLDSSSGALKLIISGADVPQSVDETILRLTELDSSQAGIDALIFDCRQTEAVKAALGYFAKTSNRPPIFSLFDPGTSGFQANPNDAIELARASSAIVAGEEYFSHFGLSRDDVMGGRLGSKGICVATWWDGSVSAVTARFSATIPSRKIRPRGSSMGAGDVFRGFFLGELLRAPRSDWGTESTIVDALRVAQAAASLRIESQEWKPIAPALDEVRNRQRIWHLEDLEDGKA